MWQENAAKTEIILWSGIKEMFQDAPPESTFSLKSSYSERKMVENVDSNLHAGRAPWVFFTPTSFFFLKRLRHATIMCQTL